MASTVINLRKAEDHRDIVHRAVQALSEGRLVVFPTETVYGLAASARSSKGVASIYEIKGRQDSSPLALAVRGEEDAFDYAPEMGRKALRLARRCWPGPVTLVIKCQPEGLASQLPREVQARVAPAGEVGFRSPAHNTIQEVLHMLVGPIALTSANLSGEPSPKSIGDIPSAVTDGAELIIDDGPCRYGQSSTVVRVNNSGIECLREGVIPLSAIERHARMMILVVCTGNTCRSPMAEAMLRQIAAEKVGCDPSDLEQRGVAVASAGIAAAPGAKPSIEAVEAMRERGLDISGHAARPLTGELVMQADVVLTLTAGHRSAIVRRWPEVEDRVATLRPDAGDVEDPIGGPVDVYRQCASQIESALRQRLAEMDLS